MHRSRSLGLDEVGRWESVIFRYRNFYISFSSKTFQRTNVFTIDVPLLYRVKDYAIVERRL